MFAVDVEVCELLIGDEGIHSDTKFKESTRQQLGLRNMSRMRLVYQDKVVEQTKIKNF